MGAVVTFPLSDFSLCRFCTSAKITTRSIYPPFVQKTHVSIKKIWKKVENFAVEKVGVWGGDNLAF